MPGKSRGKRFGRPFLANNSLRRVKLLQKQDPFSISARSSTFCAAGAGAILWKIEVMMGRNFFNDYRQKLVTADEAVKVVRSGDLVDYGFGLNSVNELDAALARRRDELRDVTIRVDYGLWPHYTLESDPAGEHFTWTSWHFSAVERKFYHQGLMSYIPMRFYECSQMLRNDCDPCRVVMIMTGPMDRHGYFNFGLSSTVLWASIERAECVIIEVNENMPRVLGGNQESIHISQVTYVVESSNPPIPTLPDTEPTDIERRIAAHVVPHIHDGSSIQLGVGGVPTAIGKMISQSDLRDLGVHTEMYVTAFMKMTEAGKITGAKKNIDRYKQVIAFALGTKELYDFIDDNRASLRIRRNIPTALKSSPGSIILYPSTPVSR
jgi:acyl-CoA hydrolase